MLKQTWFYAFLYAKSAFFLHARNILESNKRARISVAIMEKILRPLLRAAIRRQGSICRIVCTLTEQRDLLQTYFEKKCVSQRDSFGSVESTLN